MIEVIDDGSGVPPSDRPLLCEKHATSKLQNFDDLYSDGAEGLTTLGFRGEALFSLAQLSDGMIFMTKVKVSDSEEEPNSQIFKQSNNV